MKAEICWQCLESDTRILGPKTEPQAWLSGKDRWQVMCNICGSRGPSQETKAVAVICWNNANARLLDMMCLRANE